MFFAPLKFLRINPQNKGHILGKILFFLFLMFSLMFDHLKL